jgi:hypothetical protein
VDLRGPGAERTHVRNEFADLAGLRVEVEPVRARTDRNCGSVTTAACPMPLMASMLSRIPTEWMPRHPPAAQTRALICRCR